MLADILYDILITDNTLDASVKVLAETDADDLLTTSGNWRFWCGGFPSEDAARQSQEYQDAWQHIECWTTKD